MRLDYDSNSNEITGDKAPADGEELPNSLKRLFSKKAYQLIDFDRRDDLLARLPRA